MNYELRIKSFAFWIVVLTFAFCVLILAKAESALAQQVIEKYQTAVGFPEIKNPFVDKADIVPGENLSSFLTYLFNISLLVAALAAFGALVFGGVMYMTSGLADTKSKARELIQSAFIGLLLLVGTYLILLLINPALKEPKLPVFPKPVPPEQKAAAAKKGTGEVCKEKKDCVSDNCMPTTGQLVCFASPLGGSCSTERSGDCLPGLVCNPDTNSCYTPESIEF